MRAIETIYAGYRFRSRLEARWAVVPTPKQAWDAFVEWEEYGRCYLGALP
jgi:hypothetical protein